MCPAPPAAPLRTHRLTGQKQNRHRTTLVTVHQEEGTASITVCRGDACDTSWYVVITICTHTCSRRSTASVMHVVRTTFLANARSTPAGLAEISPVTHQMPFAPGHCRWRASLWVQVLLCPTAAQALVRLGGTRMQAADSVPLQCIGPNFICHMPEQPPSG